MRPLEYGDDAEYLLVPFPEYRSGGLPAASEDKRRVVSSIAPKSNTINDRQLIPRGDNIRLRKFSYRGCPLERER
jgi:hypothetical protein